MALLVATALPGFFLYLNRICANSAICAVKMIEDSII